MIVEYACGCTDVVRKNEPRADCDIHGARQLQFLPGPGNGLGWIESPNGLAWVESPIERAQAAAMIERAQAAAINCGWDQLRERFYARPRAA
jgi:hypothetical protein